MFPPYFPQLGGFYSAEDADSLPSKTDTHKKEGAFCVWDEKEIRQLLQDERATSKSGESIPGSYLFIKHYGVETEGNVKPHQVKNNKLHRILHQKHPGGTQQSFVPLYLLYTVFGRKGTPFVYVPWKIVPLSYTYGATFTKLFTGETLKTLP